ncbi:hypothetical protein [Candidatus Contubernalis alkaliaceticus]|uniref:hypothetical protein n=1 Tax=Candidatus Contubernalis alkaliaceticus TaxID=338645 RepID=UPI001F4C2ABB|nr:hypothetical protein [Candidatus Contubernalis alkalaceticus]UNC93499.1 hypothetical protein HUE98_16295 [Candidatus Contubernalis alkalaceticus]
MLTKDSKECYNCERGNEKKRIESKFEVQSYLENLKYALKSSYVTINFQKNRQVDEYRNRKYTNRYTMAQLFPDEDEVEVLKRELAFLTVEEYIETVKDTRFHKRSEMRAFGRQYSNEDVYIKIRVELVSIEHASGGSYIFVMSFHFSDRDFIETDFPYRKSEVNKNEDNKK